MFEDSTPIRQGNYWVFSTGETLPVVSGGSDGWEPPVEAPEGQGDPLEGLSEFGKDYIQRNVSDPTHIPIVAQHIKQWDAGATKKFQEYAEQVKPWKELNVDPTYARGAVELANRMRYDPHGTVRALIEGGLINPEELGFAAAQQQQQAQQNGQQGGLDPTVAAALEKMLEQRLGPLQGGLGAVATIIKEQQDRVAYEQQSKAFDNEVARLKQQYGENNVDEDFILAMMAQTNTSPEDAQKMWMQKIDAVRRSAMPPRAPFNMPGQGTPPNFQQKPTDIPDDQMVNYVANILMQGNQ